MSFAHSNGSAPLLDGCTLAVGRGQRILLEGPSGGGKSTFAAVLAGLRQPSTGSVVRRGQVVLAPQFHENYVLLAPLVVNLLLGRGWPASPGDVADAEAVCQALGLGCLLDRMPAGLAQIVGETGWQLSHGERSLVYVARTLLQGGELVVVDESFGALDPLTLATALPAALERVPALLVIRQ